MTASPGFRRGEAHIIRCAPCAGGRGGQFTKRKGVQTAMADYRSEPKQTPVPEDVDDLIFLDEGGWVTSSR